LAEYNKAAVQNSADLCRVLSSNNDVLGDHLGDTQRIVDELTKCIVPAAPNNITQSVTDSFVDPTLQHNTFDEKNKHKKVLKTYGDCEVRDLDSQVEAGDEGRRKREMDTYLMVRCN